MAIIKISKNMIVKTINKETIICGNKLEEITEKKWVEATDPCNAKFSVLDQGYVNEENISFDQIDLKFLLLEQKFWSSKPKHSKDIKLWKIKKK